MTYVERIARSSPKIIKINKRTFKIKSDIYSLFRLDDGFETGLTDKSSMATISKCELLENQNEIEELKKEFAYNKKNRDLLYEIKIFDFSKLDNTQLEKIINLTKKDGS